MCEADGTWHGASHTCVEKLCVEPPLLLNGEAFIDGTTQPQKATFSCNLGYNVTGDEVTTCSLGQWLTYK